MVGPKKSRALVTRNSKRFRVQGFKVEGLGFRAYRVQGFRLWGLGFTAGA